MRPRLPEAVPALVPQPLDRPCQPAALPPRARNSVRLELDEGRLPSGHDAADNGEDERLRVGHASVTNLPVGHDAAHSGEDEGVVPLHVDRHVVEASHLRRSRGGHAAVTRRSHDGHSPPLSRGIRRR